VEGHSTVEDRQPINSYRRVCCEFVGRAASSYLALCFVLTISSQLWESRS